MGDKKHELTCPGIVIGTKIDKKDSKISYIFGKGKPGDELWIFQGTRTDGKKTGPSIIPVRDGRGLWVGIGKSEKERGCLFMLSDCLAEAEGIDQILWIIQIVIGMVSGYETSVNLNPPKLGPEYDRQAPGERIAILRIGEMKVKPDE